MYKIERLNYLLEELYESKWETLCEELIEFNKEEPDDKDNLATHPLLIKVDEQYINADVKVMFFGKETNTWFGVFSEDEEEDYKSTIKYYESFYLNKDYEKYGKPFWNYIKKLKTLSFLDSSKKIGYVWNNVLKVGKSEAGTPQQGLLNYTLKYFNVIPQEIEILQPDVLIFFTGHTYDKYISERIGNFTIQSISNFNPQKFCRLIFNDKPDLLALRTYHPGYLQRLSAPERKDIFNTIVNLINEN